MRSLAAKRANVRCGTIIFEVDPAKRDTYVHIMATEVIVAMEPTGYRRQLVAAEWEKHAERYQKM